MMILTLLILAMTLTLGVAMAVNICRASIMVDILFEEGHALVLRLAQEQRNKWALVHLLCGVAVFIIVWLFRKYLPEAPESTSVAMAIYAGTCFFYAALESIVAYRIEKLCAILPVPKDTGANGKPYHE